MPRRRALKGVACGLADTFISRNNDLSGYWGIGMLYREVSGLPTPQVLLDLGQEQSRPNGSIARAEVSRYRDRLRRLLAGVGYSWDDLAKATITVRYGTFGTYREPRVYSYGEPFVCTVTITSINGHTYEAARTGRATPHDPSRETRSNRTSAL
jgi:hypothetical protein